jgi:hypothetical protein
MTRAGTGRPSEASPGQTKVAGRTDTRSTSSGGDATTRPETRGKVARTSPARRHSRSSRSARPRRPLGCRRAWEAQGANAAQAAGPIGCTAGLASETIGRRALPRQARRLARHWQPSTRGISPIHGQRRAAEHVAEPCQRCWNSCPRGVEKLPGQASQGRQGVSGYKTTAWQNGRRETRMTTRARRSESRSRQPVSQRPRRPFGQIS